MTERKLVPQLSEICPAPWDARGPYWRSVWLGFAVPWLNGPRVVLSSLPMPIWLTIVGLCGIIRNWANWLWLAILMLIVTPILGLFGLVRDTPKEPVATPAEETAAES